MPYSSKSQQRAMHAKCATGEIDPKVCKKFDTATKHTKAGFKGLPEHVKVKAHKKKAPR